jgi:hypothetical protein
VISVLVLGGLLFALYRVSPLANPPPGCTVTLGSPTDPDDVSAFTLTPEQADSAATIAGVGTKLGMPDHAVTVAIATSLQETGLRNLGHGDRDSLGLFQQRPSQGWGDTAQLTDPVFAATAFYAHLRRLPNWADLEVTEAAQLVQRSAAPEAYAQWEPQARAIAAALTGEADASLTCHDLVPEPAASGLANLARRELGAADLSGTHPPDRGRALANWLVAHAVRLAVDRVTVDGMTWTTGAGEWNRTGPADGVLSLHQAGSPG